MVDEPSARGASGSAPPWQHDRESGDGPGASLKKHRKGLEISLQEIAEHTRISESILEAIEADRDGDLPAPVFVRGFLRQYARYVGLDPDQVVSHYVGSHAGRERPTPTSEVGRDSGSGVWVWVAVGVLLIAVGGGYWFYGRSVSNATPTALPVEVAPNAGEPDDTTAAPRRENPAAARSEDPTLAAEGGVDGATQTQTSGGQPQATADPASAEALPTTLQVTIDFVEDCWVESSVDGVRQISTLYAKGESLRLEAETELRVFLGNYTGAVVQINGRPYDWPAGDSGDATRELTIDAEFVAALAGGGPQAARDSAATRAPTDDRDEQAPIA